MTQLGYINELDQFCTTVYDRRVLAAGDYGRFSVTHTSFKSTLCYAIKTKNIVSSIEFKLLKNGGAWYRPQKSDLLIPWTDIDAANLLLSKSLKNVFERHTELHVGNRKSIGMFTLKV